MRRETGPSYHISQDSTWPSTSPLCHCLSALSLIFSSPFFSFLLIFSYFLSSLLISSPFSLSTPCLFQHLSDVILLWATSCLPFCLLWLCSHSLSSFHSLLHCPLFSSSTAFLVSSPLICHFVKLAKLCSVWYLNSLKPPYRSSVTSLFSLLASFSSKLFVFSDPTFSSCLTLNCLALHTILSSPYCSFFIFSSFYVTFLLAFSFFNALQMFEHCPPLQARTTHLAVFQWLNFFSPQTQLLEKQVCGFFDSKIKGRQCFPCLKLRFYTPFSQTT